MDIVNIVLVCYFIMAAHWPVFPFMAYILMDFVTFKFFFMLVITY